ncbi:MAG: hypothetical protein K0S44_1774 [Bacteroidetes bacterium]|nr:hypothetical protein [Bacteroidota bacterium]
MNTFRYHILIVSYLFFNSAHLFSQKENNFWHFGQNAGLDFNSGAPIPFANSALNHISGTSSISDSNGILLFYTNGITVWNKNNLAMPNGNGLMGHNGSRQGPLIVKQPGNDSIYYIFTTDYRFNFPQKGFRYSVVNMNLQNGLGDVIQKNTPLLIPATEQQTAIKHCNNTDVWIITHDKDTTAFYSYLLTSSGIASSVVSYTGIGNPSTNTDGMFLKPSPYGNKIAQLIGNASTLTTQIFKFNRSSGQIQLENALSVAGQAIEFSPDGKKIFIATQTVPLNGNSYTIWQYNLLAGSAVNIANSKIQVGVTKDICQSFQIAPNGKIYVTRNNNDSLGVINYPDSLGLACNYVENGVGLLTKLCKSGLPNFYYINSVVPINIGSFNYYDTVFGDTTFFNLPDAVFVDSVKWNFDDLSTGVNNFSNTSISSHLFSSVGTYNVQCIVFYPCYNDTLWSQVAITMSNSVKDANKELSLLNLYPNPVSNEISIQYNSLSANQTLVDIKNILGETLYSISSFSQPGLNLLTIDLDILNSGLYFLHISNTKGNLIQPFIKQ